MNSMNAMTAAPINGIDHLEQSIRDILTTPVGSRVMRRDYGSQLPQLIDQPINDMLVGKMQVAIATALSNHEPRVRFNSVSVEPIGNGNISVNLSGYYIAENRPISFGGITI